jgi:NADH:ubiquinone oxidoreductase subunit 5 (subunit L)/multisubunit Na+/H+ antiporter MnhA subunit
MSSADTVFWVMVTRPLFLLVIAFMVAVLVYLFRRHWPDGRIKHYFLVARPEVRRRHRMQKEAEKRERDFAAYDKGNYYGKRIKTLLSDRNRH